MNLTGTEIVNRRLVVPGFATKQDDGLVPSFGPDPGGYTMTAAVNWERYVLQPLSSIKFKTAEFVDIPKHLTGLLFCKSTYARQGIILVTNTPADGGYKGQLTIRLFNSGDEPVTLYGMGGFLQIVFSQNEGAEAEAYTGRWSNGEQIEHVGPTVLESR